MIDTITRALPCVLAGLAVYICIRTIGEKKAPWWAVALYWTGVFVYWMLRAIGG